MCVASKSRIVQMVPAIPADIAGVILTAELDQCPSDRSLV